MNTLALSKAKIALANHGIGKGLDEATGEGVSAGFCHYMLGRNNAKYNEALSVIGVTMSANYNLTMTDYGEAPPEDYAKTRSYIDYIGAAGGALEMQCREGFILAGEGAIHTSRALEGCYTQLLQFLAMFIYLK